MLMFSTRMRPAFGFASMTRPCLPRSLPLITCTVSPLRTFNVCAISQHLWGQRNDFHEVLLAQLARDRPEDAGAARVALVVDDHGGVLVERDRRSVVAAERLLRADDDRAHDLALLHSALRRRRLDRADDDVAHARIAAMMAAHHANAEQLAGASVVGDLEARLLLYHLATSTISASRQCFVFDSGRVSTMRTTSPTCALFCSSCAWNLIERRITFLYFGCDRTASTLTTIVLSIASETTTPRRSWRRPRSCSGFSSREIGLRVVARSRVGRVFCGRSERGSRLPFFFGSDCGAGVASASGSSAAISASAGSSVGDSSTAVPDTASAVSDTSGSRSTDVSLVSSVFSFSVSSAISYLFVVAADCRSFCTVRMRAISRFVSFRRALFSSAPVTDWNRRLNSSCRRSVRRSASSSSVNSRSSLGLVKELSLSFHNFAFHRQLLARETERFLGQRLR